MDAVKLEKLTSRLDDDELRKYILHMVYSSDISTYRTTEKIIKLAKAIKSYGYSKRTYRIACDRFVLENRTTDEQIRLMEALEDFECGFYADDIPVNANILKARNTDEQIRLMEAFKPYNSYNCDSSVHAIVTNPNILEARTTEEQICLIEALKACKYHPIALLIAINPNVLKYRTIKEQICLMITLKVCENNIYSFNILGSELHAFNIAVSEDVLKSTAIEQQINMMLETLSYPNKQSQTCESQIQVSKSDMHYFYKKIEEIKTTEGLKQYLEFLNNNEIVDVKEKTLVPKKDNKKKQNVFEDK